MKYVRLKSDIVERMDREWDHSPDDEKTRDARRWHRLLKLVLLMVGATHPMQQYKILVGANWARERIPLDHVDLDLWVEQGLIEVIDEPESV